MLKFVEFEVQNLICTIEKTYDVRWLDGDEGENKIHQFFAAALGKWRDAMAQHKSGQDTMR